jgi:hypothetical protein
VRISVRALAAAVIVTMSVPAVAVASPAKPVSTTFDAPRSGEALLTMRALAPGADWGDPGRESAVVTLTVDGRFNQDVVLFGGDQPFDYKVALGPLSRGRHTITAAFNPAKSPPAVRSAQIKSLQPSLAEASGDAGLVYRYSPIVYGRDLPEIPGAYENNHTDVPLLTYHEVTHDAAGNTVIEYTEIWSNEDGGTNTPALMARWGRTTDIEWIYRVTLDRSGRVVSEYYQAPNHQTLPFTGARLGDHPMLQTGTANNNMNQVTDPAQASGYRFIPDPSQALPANRAREVVMDANPWSYQVMAKEMIREGKVESPADPATPEMSDQRNYLWAEIDKDTSYPTPPLPGTWVGTALAVKLAGDDRWYTSNHNVPDWSIQRDIPAATTVELPAGKTAADVEAVKAFAVPVPSSASPAPADYRIDVTSVNRGFFLDTAFLPAPSFLAWTGDVVLTPDHPEGILWQR